MSISAASLPAFAQDVAGAEVLFQEGRRLMEAKDYAGACAKFEASQRAAPAVGTLLNLAECFEKRNMVASAWLTFRSAVSEAQRVGRADREALARERAALLEKRVPKVTITAPRTPGLVVKRDDVVVDPALFGTPVPVDLGTHTITATAPRKQTWSTQVSITVEGSVSQVAIPSLQDVAITQETEAELALEQPPPPPKEEGALRLSTSEGSSQRTIGSIVGGVGLAGLAAGGIFGLGASSKWSDAKEHCRGTLCDREGVTLRDDATSSATLSTVFFIAGGVATAAGIVLVVTAPRGTKREAGLRVVPVAAPGGAGLCAGGAF
jgi:hypothetical protein